MCVTFLFVVTLGCSLICSQLEFVSEESALSKLHKKKSFEEAEQRKSPTPTETISPRRLTS